MPRIARSTSEIRDYRRFGLVTFLVVALCAVWYSLDPNGTGGVVRLLAISVLLLGTAVGPFRRGVEPVKLWVLIPVAVVFLWLQVFLPNSGDGAPVPTDFLVLFGYAAFGAWVVILAFGVGRQAAVHSLLDSSAVSIGVVLVLWTYAANTFGVAFTTAIAWAVYPLLNVAVAALILPMVVGVGAKVPSWRLLFLGLINQTFADLSYSMSGFVSTADEIPVLTAMKLFSYYFICAAAWHPSVSRMTSTPLPARTRRSSTKRAVVLVASIMPVAVVLNVPIRSSSEGVIRTVLIIALLVVLLFRLLSTMRALSDAERDMWHRAMHDDLTGLPNRAAMFEALDASLERGARRGHSTAMLFVDCDGFKQVNDTWGHPVGDRLLRSVAAKLPERLSPDQVVARHGGDEFVVIADVASPDEAFDIARTVLEFFAEPFRVMPGNDLHVTASIGVALALPGESLTPTDLLGRADVALYQAKAEGRDRAVVYDQDLHERTTKRAVLAEALRAAIVEDRIAVAFQPLMGGPGYGTVIGWESLARWTEPGYGPVRPDVFIPLAEELGLIHELGDNVLRRSVFELAEMRRTVGPADAIVSVNVSGYQLGQHTFTRVVQESLEEAGLTGEALWLEITETHLVDGGERVLTALARLHELGVHVVLDDFGTGYSTMSTLRTLPFDVVKIDRSLVAGIDSAPEVSEQVQAIISLLASMGIQVAVAEGVETAEQAHALELIGCPMGQGWHFGYPTAPDELRADSVHGEARSA